MKKYQSHKVVEAFKISKFHPAPDMDGYYLIGDDGEKAFQNEAWMKKHAPDGEANMVVSGYWVRYKDGYTSWSPAETFEEGYTEMGRVEEDQGIVHGGIDGELKGRVYPLVVALKYGTRSLHVFGEGFAVTNLCDKPIF